MNESTNSTSTLDTSIELPKKEPYTTQTIKSIASLLNQIIIKNTKTRRFPHQTKDSFQSSLIPSLSIEEYLTRIVHYTQIQLPTLVSSMIYIAHIIKNKDFIVGLSNIHRVLIASCFMSAKFNEDSSHSFVFFAKVGGVSEKELIQLEYEFYILNDFLLFIKESIYQKYYKLLVKEDDLGCSDNYY